MWIFTTDGFYSAVHKQCGPDEVMVRARCKEDILRLIDQLRARQPDMELTPTRTEGRDYLWRVVVPRVAWAGYLADRAETLDYANFKDRIGHDDPARSAAYIRVWDAMYEFQSRKNRA